MRAGIPSGVCALHMHGWHSRVLHTRRAVLFKIEAAVRIRETKTVTDVPAYWMMPANVEKVQAEVGYKIDFTSGAAKRVALDKCISQKNLRKMAKSIST